MSDSNRRRTLGLRLAIIIGPVSFLVISVIPCIRQCSTVRWVRAQGGEVYTESVWLTLRLPNTTHDWLLDKGWLEYVERVTIVDLGGTQVTDADMHYLKGLTSLQQLILYRTQVGDQGLKHLKGMTSLELLNLGGTPVTDLGLKQLKDMSALDEVTLALTLVTQAGVEDLTEAHPFLRVHY